MVFQVHKKCMLDLCPLSWASCCCCGGALMVFLGIWGLLTTEHHPKYWHIGSQPGCCDSQGVVNWFSGGSIGQGKKEPWEWLWEWISCSVNASLWFLRFSHFWRFTYFTSVFFLNLQNPFSSHKYPSRTMPFTTSTHTLQPCTCIPTTFFIPMHNSLTGYWKNTEELASKLQETAWHQRGNWLHPSSWFWVWKCYCLHPSGTDGC